VKHAKTILRTYKVELRELDKENRKVYEARAAEHEETVNLLLADLNIASDDAERAELVRHGDVELGVREQKIKKAARLQQEDLRAVARMEKQIATTQQIGTAVTERMHTQTEQLAKASEVLDEQKELLKFGSLQLRSITRRISTDKCLQGCICIVLLLIIVVIVLAIVKPDLGPGNGLQPIQDSIPPGVIPNLPGDEAPAPSPTEEVAPNTTVANVTVA
jgi:hypothetical protein